jgi:hypothetical protein
LGHPALNVELGLATLKAYFWCFNRSDQLLKFHLSMIIHFNSDVYKSSGRGLAKRGENNHPISQTPKKREKKFWYFVLGDW